jgi:hypothetical protein
MEFLVLLLSYLDFGNTEKRLPESVKSFFAVGPPPRPRSARLEQVDAQPVPLQPSPLPPPVLVF